MLAELLNVSEEQVSHRLATMLYGNPDVPIALCDVMVLVIALSRQVLELRGRFNQYDAKSQGKLLTVNEVIRLTGLSRSSVYRKMRHSIFMSIKADGRRLIYRRCIEQWLRVLDEHRASMIWNPAPSSNPASPANSAVQSSPN